MIIKKQVFIGLLFCIVTTFSQNKNILFGFDEVPQSLLVNPGLDVNYNAHFGIPLLSGVYVHAGISGFNISDLFEDDGIDINSKLRDLLSQTSSNDFYTVNQQLEIFNAGYRLNNKRDYFSFGFYEELDVIAYHPKDYIAVVLDGNKDIDRLFDASDLSFKAELLGVFHAGISRKINNKLTVGLRAKLYSSVFNATSRVNTGLFVTREGQNNIYSHQFIDVNMEVKTSGITDENNEVVAQDGVIGKFLVSGNMGLGLDFGLTYKPKENIEITASMQDLGFIHHRKNVTNYKIEGNFDFEGLEFQFPSTLDGIDYWQNFEDDVTENIGLDTLNVKYTTLRSLKFNGSVAYKFGKKNRNNCLRSESKNKLANEVGVQLYSIFRPKQPQVAATLYYYRRLSKQLRFKTTYTANSYSFANIGIGLTTHFNKFNFYATADNLLGYADLSKSQNQSIQFGMNMIFD